MHCRQQSLQAARAAGTHCLLLCNLAHDPLFYCCTLPPLTMTAFLLHGCVCPSQDDGLDSLVRRVHQHHPDCSLMVATWGLQVRTVTAA